MPRPPERWAKGGLVPELRTELFPRRVHRATAARVAGCPCPRFPLFPGLSYTAGTLRGFDSPRFTLQITLHDAAAFRAPARRPPGRSPRGGGRRAVRLVTPQ